MTQTPRKKRGSIFIISGPSGSGKTTLYKKLLGSTDKLVKSVSMTTRPIRRGEKHGRDYIFVSPKMFLYKKRGGHLLESEKVFGHHYGTPKGAVRELLKSGKNILLCIDVKGARNIKRQFPYATTIFIKTPSLAELKKRLGKRGSENKTTIMKRLERARLELDQAKRYDYVIVNDNVEHAFGELKRVVNQILK